MRQWELRLNVLLGVDRKFRSQIFLITLTSILPTQIRLKNSLKIFNQNWLSWIFLNLAPSFHKSSLCHFSPPILSKKLVKFWCWLRSMYSFYWTVLCNDPPRKVNRDKIELKIWVKQREGIFIFYYLFYCSISYTNDNENSNWNWYDERQLAQQQQKLGINFLQFSKHEAANERNSDIGSVAIAFRGERERQQIKQI